LQILNFLKSSKFGLIERERHPSWVSFTLSSFPSKSIFSVFDSLSTGANAPVLFYVLQKELATDRME